MRDIIILAAASPDGTADIIAAELAKHRHRIDIRFVRNDRNLGSSANERKGVSLAEGDFIIVFSGDDIMLPTMVEQMTKFVREHRSEEHTSELQSHLNLVCRLLLEIKRAHV